MPSQTPRREPLYVLYDAQCGFCCRTAGFLRFSNWLGQLRLVDAHDRQQIDSLGLGFLSDEQLMRDMHAAESKGEGRWLLAQGYAAYQQIAWRVPLLWPLLLVIYLPPVAALGRYVYRRVADSRVCSIPSK